MTDKQRIEQLEARVKATEAQLDELRAELAKAELDQWRGRIDDLELQVRLGSMEADDRLAPLMERLRNAWLDARSTVLESTGVASEVTERIRTGLEEAMSDLRRTALDIRSTVKD